MVFGARAHQDKIYVVRDPASAVLGTNFLGPLAMFIDCKEQTVRTIKEQGPASYLKDFPQLLSTDLGTFPRYQHRIQMSPDATPQVARLRPIPFARREAVREEIEAMDQAGIWEPVQASQWAHPLVTVPKSGGGMRITTDLTALNPFVIPQRHPLPHIKDLFLELSGARIFSKLDLRKGYFHVLLHPKSRDLTTTLTPLGMRRYCRLPMGLKDSASVFQRLIQQALAGAAGVIYYIDDIIVYGSDQETHDRNLRRALAALAAHDFRLQMGKCAFSQPSISAFGHIISKDGIQPHPDNLRPIREAKAPSNVKEVLAFLGMVNFYQDFLPNLSRVAEPLRALTRKDVPFDWTPSCQKALSTLQEMCMEQLHLHIFDPKAPTYVTTDASDVGIGATLTQLQNGKEHPIACFNRTLSAAERNYAANEREILACLLAMEHWEKYLLGTRFTLQTDHQPLRQLLQPASRRQSSKFERWRERFSHFDFVTEYLPGPQNQIADGLSRLRDIPNQTEIKGIRCPDLHQGTRGDPLLQKIASYLAKAWPHQNQLEATLKPWYQQRFQLAFKDGLLYWTKWIVPPSSMYWDILQAAHQGHPGMVRMKRILRRTYWWPGMGSAAEEYVRHCGPCQKSTKSRPALRIPKAHIPRAATPASQWALDITGPFFNGQYLVVAVDSTSGFPEVLSTKSTSSDIIIHWLSDLFARYGNPDASSPIMVLSSSPPSSRHSSGGWTYITTPQQSITHRRMVRWRDSTATSNSESRLSPTRLRGTKDFSSCSRRIGLPQPPTTGLHQRPFSWDTKSGGMRTRICILHSDGPSPPWTETKREPRIGQGTLGLSKDPAEPSTRLGTGYSLDSPTSPKGRAPTLPRRPSRKSMVTIPSSYLTARSGMHASSSPIGCRPNPPYPLTFVKRIRREPALGSTKEFHPSAIRVEQSES